MKTGRQKFLLYTNPNNVTNFAYIALGAYHVNEVLRSARSYPDSYTILLKGMGKEEDVKTACAQFRYYKFINN
jgi:hypothetical protein